MEVTWPKADVKTKVVKNVSVTNIRRIGSSKTHYLRFDLQQRGIRCSRGGSAIARPLTLQVNPEAE
jgi:hypothetical protein